LPNTFLLVDVEDLRTDPNDLASIPIPPFTEGGKLVIPHEVKQLGEIKFSGNFTGFTRSFTAFGSTTTDLGVLRTDLSYERDTMTNVFTISGRAATSSMDLGPLLGTNSVGRVGANIRIRGRGTSLAGMRADLDGTFPMFTLDGRKITGITANGTLERDLFNGKLQVNDEHLVMTFQGLADMRGRWPQVDFDAQVQHFDLKAFGLAPAEDYSTLSMLVNVKGRLSPDSLLGRLDARKVSYCNERGEHELGDIILRSGRTQGRNVLELEADFADATITGVFLPTKLAAGVANVMYSVFPSLQQVDVDRRIEQDFNFEIYTKHTAQVLDLFIPGMVIDSGAVFIGGMKSAAHDLDLAAEIPGIKYRDLYARDLDVIVDKTLDVLVFSIGSERQIWKDSVWFDGTSITGKAYQDEVEIALGWDASSSGTNGEIDLLGEVRGPRSLTLDLQPSKLHFGRGNWENREAVHFEIDSSTVHVDSLILHNDGQQLIVDGTISRDPAHFLTLIFDDVRLENLDPLIQGPGLSGAIDGSGKVFDLYRSPIISSDLRIDSVVIDGYEIGDLVFEAGWTQGRRSIDLKGRIDRDRIKALDFGGVLILDEEQTLAIDLAMDRFDLTFIEPYLPAGLSDIQGTVTGVVDVSGRLKDPQVNGELELVNAGLRINYLNTLYTFDHLMKIAPDMFAFDNVTIHDEEGNTGLIGGTLIHKGLKDWNFDIWGTMDGLMVMNTTLEQNDLFYGKAYGHGEVAVSGYAGNMDIHVDARTAEGTDIHFPIGGSTEVSDIGFIRFISPDSLDQQVAAVDLTGISLDMNIEVTPDAHFELIFDPTVGDILSGRGQGNIEMGVTPTGQFDMRGQVEISDGDYLFTLRNVVNKRFQILSGGRIIWYGDPLNANLDLQATYRVRAPLYDIMFEKNEAYRRRVPIDVVMHLRERLMNPEINFEIRLPTVDEAVRTQVQSAMSTEDELNRQVFALIVLNRFISSSAQQGETAPEGRGGSVAGTTTSELLSSQVSNWLSRLSNDFDLGVNYRPGDNITNDELEVAVSTQLFAERLLLSTNLGVAYGQQTTQTSNTLIGDFQVEYLLTRDGKLRLKAFSQSNDRNLNRADQALTTQGAGLAFREEFNYFGEFVQHFLDLFRSEEKDRNIDQTNY
nr:translocation/assembly module TamB domain-containing protein [Bacteroidota bacterium]